MWNDLRFALRTLRRSPGFTVLAVLSLALGIGANTAIFSLLYQVVLRAVPVKDPGSLYSLESDDNNYGTTRRDNNLSVFSYPMYKALRDHNEVFSGLVARVSYPATLTSGREAARTTVEAVTGNLFEVLGVHPAMGRLLLPSDDAPGQSPVIVLSYDYWTGHLGADPLVVNSRMLMNGQPVLVAGVAPRGFRGLLTGRDPDLFAPMSMMGTIAPGMNGNDRVDFYSLNIVGRLKPNVGPERAHVMLLPLFRSVLRDEVPQLTDIKEDDRKKILARPINLQPAAQGLNQLRMQWQTPLAVLEVMVGLVLLIACANVANLLIARATARQREIAIRLAVGATRWQLLRQLMVESGILALGGGIVGLFLSQNLTQGLLGLMPEDAAGGWLAPQLDARMLGYSVALALLAGLLFGLAPALQAMRTGVAPALKEQSGGMSASGSQSRTRQGLMVAQICLSLLLLTGAGLFTRSLLNLVHSDPGFRTDHLITFTIDPSLSGYTFERRLALFRDLRQKLGALPGARASASAYLIPLGGWGWGGGVKAPGSRNASQEFVSCNENSVSPGYFAALGIPLRAGRDFNANDTPKSASVAIVSEAFARFLYEGANPIGRHIHIGNNDADAEIVGVVRDSRINDVREQPPRVLYVPFEQGGDQFTLQSAFFVRTQSDEAGLTTAIRASVRQLDRNLPIERLTSMKLTIDDSIYRDRLMATLAMAFGALAAILAAVGLYGAISYSVARRTREFGIRLVLGAAPESLLLFVLREVGWLIGIGVAVGAPASYLLARLAESQFYGVRAHDPWTLAGATVLIAMVGVAAGLAPAVRAMRIAPLDALRYE
ncbi:MAG: ABC transporter permease [Bryobacteraceae bacterium]|jgi:predicted permease